MLSQVASPQLLKLCAESYIQDDDEDTRDKSETPNFPVTLPSYDQAQSPGSYPPPSTSPGAAEGSGRKVRCLTRSSENKRLSVRLSAAGPATSLVVWGLIRSLCFRGRERTITSPVSSCLPMISDVASKMRIPELRLVSSANLLLQR